MSIYIIDPYLKIRFLKILESDGVVNMKRMSALLNVDLVELGEIISELMDEKMIEKIPTGKEDAGKIQLSEIGVEYIGDDYKTGDKVEVQDAGRVVDEEVVIERTFDEKVVIWKSILSYVSEGRVVETKDELRRMSTRIGTANAQELQNLLETMVSGRFVTRFIPEDTRRKPYITISDTGKMILSGEGRFVEEGAEDVSEAAKEEAEMVDEPVTIDHFTRVLDYVFTTYTVPATLLDHKILQKKLKINANNLEYIIGDLLENRYLEIVDGNIRVQEGVVKDKNGNWPLNVREERDDAGAAVEEVEDASEESKVEDLKSKDTTIDDMARQELLRELSREVDGNNWKRPNREAAE